MASKKAKAAAKKARAAAANRANNSLFRQETAKGHAALANTSRGKAKQEHADLAMHHGLERSTRKVSGKGKGARYVTGGSSSSH